MKNYFVSLVLLGAIVLNGCGAEAVPVVTEAATATVTEVPTATPTEAAQPTATPTEVVEEEPTAPPQTELVYNSIHTMYTSIENNADSELVNQFQDAHPEFMVVKERPPRNALYDFPNYPTPTDLVSTFPNANIQGHMAAGNALDISDLWQQEGWQATYPAWATERSIVEGKQYYLPTAYIAFGLYYHKPTFEQYGLQPPETWEEFLAVSERLKENGVVPAVIQLTQAPFSLLYSGAWFDYLDMRLNGPEFHQAVLQGQVSYEEPELRAVFETWQALLSDGIFETVRGPGSAVIRASAGEVGMFVGENSYFVVNQASIPESLWDEFGFVRFPIMNSELPVGVDVTTFGYLAPAATEKPEAARQFLKFQGSPEAQALLTGSLMYLPTHREVDTSGLRPESIVGLSLVETADTVVEHSMTGLPSEMVNQLNQSIQQLIINPADLDKVITDLEEARTENYGDGTAP